MDFSRILLAMDDGFISLYSFPLLPNSQRSVDMLRLVSEKAIDDLPLKAASNVDN